MKLNTTWGELIVVAVAAIITLLVSIRVTVIVLAALRLPLLDRTTAHDGHLSSQAVLFRFRNLIFSALKVPQTEASSWVSNGSHKEIRAHPGPKGKFPVSRPGYLPSKSPSSSLVLGILCAHGGASRTVGARLAKSANSMKRAE